ncbi:MAG: hypothetical protein PHF67_02295 [Candidatus Nanoarchaeia archaeon]|nr:hypothetical protein [Candidatus Nanoarchaeia archaeon]
MKRTLIFLSIALILITLFTHYYGSIDIGDYSDSAKYLAGDYQAKIRVSHSFLYGIFHAPFISLLNNFIFFKVTSLIFLFLIIYSVYFISNKNKNSLLLSLFSPIVWYMAPWINPLQLAGLLLLWGFYFIDRYDKKNNLKDLFLSGVLIGLCISFWNTAIYFSIIFLLVFLFNKKFSNVILFSLSCLIGLIPLFVTDYLLFNFPFYTLIKTGFSQILFIVFKESLYSISSSNKILDLLFVFLFLPLYFWLIYKPSFFKENKKKVIFVTLSLLVILTNPQIRYVIAIAPIIILLLSEILTPKQIKKYLIFSTILILIILIPYSIQINHNINGSYQGMEIREFAATFNNLSFSEKFPQETLQEDLLRLSEDFPNQTFLVGNNPDDYQILADLYWGKGISEFVSIQDYNLWFSNNTVLFQKKFMPAPNIEDRRQIWIIGGMSKNEKDPTDYKNIKYAITINQPLKIEGFKFIKKYEFLNLYLKS